MARGRCCVGFNVRCPDCGERLSGTACLGTAPDAKTVEAVEAVILSVHKQDCRKVVEEAK